MMTKWIIGPLVIVLAIPSLKPGLANAPVIPRAAQAQWKANLEATRLQQLQVQRQAQLARREAALSTRQALIAQRQAGASAQFAAGAARLAAQARPAAAVGYQAILQRFETIRERNPVAFDRRFPQVAQALQRGTQLRVAAAQEVRPLNGLLPDTPFNRYLHWRRSLNPTRFDFYHPRLGPILAEDQRLRETTNPTPCPGETVPPPTDPPPVLPPPIGGGEDPPPAGGDIDPPPIDPPPGGGDEPPPAIPEPGAILLLTIGLGIVGWRSRKHWQPNLDAS